MPAFDPQLLRHLPWTRIGGITVSLAAVLRTFLAIWQYLERRRDRRRIEKSFGADYYPSETIDAALRYYVRPYCMSVDPSQEAEIRQVVATREDLFEAVERFLDKESPYRHILLLADSGMGKTTFVISYYGHNLKKRRRRRLAVVPLAIPTALDDISKIELKKDTVLFLDAFDEDPKAMEDHRARLNELMKVCSVFKRVLITCRTQFFASDEEIPKDTGVMLVAPRQLGESAVYEFWKLYISPLTDEQIKEYLRRRFSWLMFMKRRKAYRLIAKIPLLTARPMLLAYLPDVLRAGQRIQHAFQLYEVLVEEWLKREEGWIDPRQLREFSEKLAIDLYTNRKKRRAERLPPDELPKLLHKFGKPLDALVIRRRSLLNRDALGNLKFAHRSIMEYLFVRSFVNLAPDQRPNVAWTDLMKVFAIEMLRAYNAPDRPDVGRQQLQMQSADLSGAKVRSVDEGVMLNAICLDNARLQKADFAGTNLVGCSFKHADLSGADFSRCKLMDVDFTGADLRYADFTGTALPASVLMTGANTSGALMDEEQEPQLETKGKPGFSFRSTNAAIDLGTANTLVFVEGKGVVLYEPSIVAISKSTGQVRAAGSDAAELFSKAPRSTYVQRPLADGTISDPDLAAQMLRYFLMKLPFRTVSRAIFAVPSEGPKANWHVLCDVARTAKLTKVSLVESCMVAAIGAGLPIEEPSGNMVLDIGGGKADIAVISMNGIVYSQSLRRASNEMDKAIILYLKRKYNLLVGEDTAEQIKITIGSAYPLEEPLTMEVKGRNLIEDVPRIVTIDDSEIREALSESVATILNAVHTALERTPPELSADISDRGIVMTGGGSLLKNLDKRIREQTGLPVSIADDPLACVVLGCGKLLSDWKLVEKIRVFAR